MKTTIATSSALVALSLAFGAAAAERTLEPLQAYPLGNDDRPTVLYYTGNEAGYEVVTTWIDDQGVQMRHIAYLDRGQRYTLSLIERGLPVRFTIHGNAARVVMDGAEQSKYAQQCDRIEAFGPTPVQRQLLCPRDRRVTQRAEFPAAIGLTSR